MCAIPFSPPKTSYTPPPLPDPNPSAEAIRTAEAEERRRLRLARGRESTILTSPLGIPGAGTTSGKKLLGE